MFQKILETARAGDNVGILIRGIQKKEVKRGMVLSKPLTIKLYSIFESEVYVLSTNEGGRKKPFFAGYKPQFYFYTMDITGSIDFIDKQVTMVLPGDKVGLRVNLIYSIALEIGMRFAIREGGKTIAAGIITKLI